MRKLALSILWIWSVDVCSAQTALGTAFTYQGRLANAGIPMNGSYDLLFALYGAPNGGLPLAGPLIAPGVAVTGGLFTVKLDFGAGVFTGDARWLEIAVGAGAASITLGPRQELTPTPNAVFSTTSGTVAPGGVSTPQLADGAVTALKLGAGAVTAGAIASGQVVKTLNGLSDTVTIVGDGGATVSTNGDTITVSAAPPPTDCTAPGTLVSGVAGETTLIGAGYAELAPFQDMWKATSTIGAPSGRVYDTAVWTGSRMIVWGGHDYNSYFNTGGQYDPLTDSWTATSTVGAPSARWSHTSVWTGSKMIVWGGYDGSYANTGARYDPLGNSWTATATLGAPSGRSLHTAVWTGSRMIVWGGNDGTLLNTGGQYDPMDNSWTATATTPGVPAGRDYHTAVWTGSRMIVWGGSDVPFSYTNTGGRYDPMGNSWTATSTTNAPSGRWGHSAVWTGSRMIVWGGAFPITNTGGQYDPVQDSWLPTATSLGVPDARYSHTAVWTGSKMVVWGGSDSGPFNTGGQYDPSGDSWLPTALTPAVPSRRSYHTAVWTGTRMIVWGGLYNTGGQWFMLAHYMKN